MPMRESNWPTAASESCPLAASPTLACTEKAPVVSSIAVAIRLPLVLWAKMFTVSDEPNPLP